MSYIGRGISYEYEISLEATNRNWLFALDLPAVVPQEASLTRGYRLMTKNPMTQRKTYRAVSYINFDNFEMNRSERQQALKLPQNTTPRVREFAKKMAQNSTSSEQALQKILNYFYQQDFYYTLHPPKLGSNPTDAFLFETHRGFCGHYATSFTILARAMGLPARVVTGYQGGEYNPEGNYYMIRQRHAHAWVEVWLDKKGWVRFDPTAAVAPERIENEFEFDEKGTPIRFNLSSKGLLGSFAMKTRWMLDTIQVSWQKWVVGFDDDQQNNFLKKLGLENWALEKIMMSAIFSALFILTLSTLFFLYKDRIIQEPVLKIYQQWLKKLAKVGIQSAGNEGPQDLAQRVIKKRPDLALQVKPLIQSYIALRYASPNRVELKLFQRLVKQFRA
jgi:transglutaminase-like putative cysteine protease